MINLIFSLMFWVPFSQSRQRASNDCFLITGSLSRSTKEQGERHPDLTLYYTSLSPELPPSSTDEVPYSHLQKNWVYSLSSLLFKIHRACKYVSAPLSKMDRKVLLTRFSLSEINLAFISS